jgi:V/A-type H+-transporting ATPase subunit A
LGRFYERAGRIVALGSPERGGSLTLIAAISPPGGDLSEPVTQASLRVCGALWALDPRLANQRQFPAVDWETSYSLYADAVSPWFTQATSATWPEDRRALLELLQRGEELREIAGLVGAEALQDADRLALDTSRLVRELVLGQSAYDPNDARSEVAKTHALARAALELHRRAVAALERGAALASLPLGALRRALAAYRSAAPADQADRFRELQRLLDALLTLGSP